MIYYLICPHGNKVGMGDKSPQVDMVGHHQQINCYYEDRSNLLKQSKHTRNTSRATHPKPADVKGGTTERALTGLNVVQGQRE